MSRRSAILTASLAAALLSLPACGKPKPTAGDMPPGGIPAPGVGGPGMPGAPGGPPGKPGPGDPNAGQPKPAGTPLIATSSVPTRQNSLNNLKQIGLALHNAHDTYNGFPTGIADKSGKLGLSWRVAILPYIEQDTLYKQFKLDEPWDSEHNKKLIPMMPKTFAPPSGGNPGYTYYRSFSGPDTVLFTTGAPGRPGQLVLGAGLAGITDGTSNTLLVAEAAEPVIWTKPEELPFDKSKAPPKLGGGVFGDGYCVVLCSGETRFLPISFGGADLTGAITRQGGEIFNWPK